MEGLAQRVLYIQSGHYQASLSTETPSCTWLPQNVHKIQWKLCTTPIGLALAKCTLCFGHSTIWWNAYTNCKIGDERR